MHKFPNDLCVRVFAGKTQGTMAQSLDQLSKGLPQHLTQEEPDADASMAEYSLANAKKAAVVRVQEHMARLQQFDVDRSPNSKQQHATTKVSAEVRSRLGAGKINLRHEDEEMAVPQPELFRGTLKVYQLQGMNWLVRLYEQVWRFGASVP